MKLLFLLLALLTINSLSFSQSMIINKNGALKDTVDIADVDSVTFLPFQCGFSKLKYSGRIYHTVQIGSQCWLKENLDVGTRINGSLHQTDNGTIEKYCYNDDSTNCNTYGGLYEWAEAVQYQNGATNYSYPNPAFSGNIKGICPNGWHIPANSEYVTLSNTVGGNGDALKEIGQGTGTGAGTNTSGFSALLAGFLTYSKIFSAIGETGSLWRLEGFEQDPNYADSYFLFLSDNNFTLGTNYKTYAFSMRCLKD